MTDAARRDESDSNLSAFRLGVFANEFLWNLDQAVVADSEPHRRVALGLVQRLGAIGAIFTGMRTDAPLQDFLKGAREHLPDRMTGNYSVWFSDLLLAGEEDGDGINAGELWYSNFGVRSEREKLLKVIVDSTLSTTQQRQWFLLGLLIDSGRHPPDTGSHLYKFNPPRDRRHVVPVNSQSIVTNDDEDEDEDEPELPPLRVLEPGELRPGRDWWREVVKLSEQVKVPCNFVEPDLSTASSIVNAVMQMIENTSKAIAAPRPDALPLVMTRPAPLLDPPANDVEKHGLWEFVAGKVRFREGEWHKLTPIPWGILKCLAANRYPVSRMQLIEAGWKGDTNTDDNAVRTALTRLRKRLSEFVKLEKGESPINSVPTPHGDHQELHESLRLTDPVTST